MLEWTEQDIKDATAQGWCISECYGGSERGNWQLQKIDEPEEGEPTFESDEAAWEFIYKQFLVGNPVAKKALLLISEKNPLEFKLIKQHCESTVTNSGLYNPV